MNELPSMSSSEHNLPWVNYAWLAELQAAGVLRPIDVEFAQFFAQLQEEQYQESACLVASLLSASVGRKHLCLSLTTVNQNDPFLLGNNHIATALPDKPLTEALLRELQGVSCIDGTNKVPSIDAILILQRGKLYFSRYWHYEDSLANALLLRQSHVIDVNLDKAKHWLTALFSTDQPTQTTQSTKIDWQKMACAVASLNQFSVITGGPGTGKTTTVTRLLLLLNALAEGSRPVVKLVAPTGKAAMRLSESIKGAKSKLGEQLNAENDASVQNLLSNIVDDASTIHRLLGVIPHSAKFRFNEERRLPLDVLIVDEASMVDLPLMAKLVSALPMHAKIILLGDKDQLASVEAGSVLGDICQLPNLTSGDYVCGSAQQQKLQWLTGYTLQARHQNQQFSDSVIALRVSHRFDANSGIGRLATAINEGDGSSLRKLFDSPPEDVAFNDHLAADIAALVQLSVQHYRETFQKIREFGTSVHHHVAEVLACFNRFRVLCALRKSEYGIEYMNDHIEQALYRQGMIDVSANAARWYTGKPIMVSENDYQLNLFNGDIGILLPDEEGKLKAWFIQPDGSIFSVFPNRLPMHESVYAMTIHKSQGSEFDDVAILLPDHKYLGAQSIVTRELVYTGITRAKAKLHIYADRNIVLRSASIMTERASGLGERLYRTDFNAHH